MKILAVLSIFLSPFLGFTQTQEQATYYVVDMLDSRNSTLEVWIATEEDRDDTYRKIDKLPFSRRKPETEIQKVWHTEKRSSGTKTYMKEVLAADLEQLHADQRSYGYIEERDTQTDKVIASYPLFCRVDAELHGLRATFDVFLSGGMRMKIVRDYEKGMHYLPLRESRSVSLDGTIFEHVIRARKE